VKIKKQISVLLFALAAMIFVAGNAHAASWYVDNAVAASGNGQSWATAYKNFSNISWGSIHAGDFVYISGGPSGGTQTYTDSWAIVGVSGTAVNPITIGVDAANAGHNGTAVFDYDAAGETGTVDGVFFANNSYITFTGNVNGQNHIAFKNLRNIIDRWVSHCIVGYNNTGIIFDHLEITNCNNGISVSFTGTGNEIRYSNFRQIRGDAAMSVAAEGTTWDEMKIHDNSIETLVNNTPPPGQTSYGGPDGIQCSGGMSAYRNTFRVSNTTLYTSSQHPDMFQLQGNYLKIYDNEFINVGDSAIDYDCYNNSTPHDVRIYNNLFHVVQVIDWYPEYFRLYISNTNALTSINNFKLLNNTFVDNTGFDNGQICGFVTVRFNGFAANNPTGSGNEIKNNIFYNCGNGSQYQNIYIAASTGFTDASFSCDGNIYNNSAKPPYIYYNGTNYTAAGWIAAREPHGKTGAPAFVSYSTNNPNNDLHLASTDTVAKDAGISLSSYFTDDKDGVSRPQGSAWDIGAYEYVSVSNQPPVITSALSCTGIVGQAFSYQITASGSPTSYGSAGLPPGLSINTTNGVITGTPTTNGITSATISAMNSSGTNSATLTVTINSAPIGPTGLVGWWKLDENSGTTAADSSGNGNNGTLSGGTWQTAGGKIAGALHLNAFDVVNCGAAASLNTPSVTVAFWMKPDSLGNVIPVDKLPTTGSVGYAVKLRDTGTIWFRVGAEGGPALDVYGGSNIYTNGAWTHVACTFDSSSGAMRMYINGVVESHQPTFAVTLNASNTTFRMGSTVEQYAGLLDDVRVYDHALTSNEVVTVMAGGGSTSNVPPPVITLGPISSQPGMITFSWQSVTGASYAVYRTTNLLLGWTAQALTNNISGDGTMKFFMEPVGTLPEAFYRLKAAGN
jgi:hypothetical protein